MQRKGFQILFCFRVISWVHGSELSATAVVCNIMWVCLTVGFLLRGCLACAKDGNERPSWWGEPEMSDSNGEWKRT